MKITDIQPQKNHPDRYSIFLDGQYAFPMSANDLLASGLAMGQELTEVEAEQWSEQSEVSKLYDKAINYLSFRPRSRKEVADYLKRRKVEAPAAERVMSKLTERGYLDDQQFAQAFINDRATLKPTSRRKLMNELRRKGIMPDQEQLEGLDQESERQALRQVIEKKKRLTGYQDPIRLTRYLVSQGFDFSLIKQELDGD